MKMLNPESGHQEWLEKAHKATLWLRIHNKTPLSISVQFRTRDMTRAWRGNEEYYVKLFGADGKTDGEAARNLISAIESLYRVPNWMSQEERSRYREMHRWIVEWLLNGDPALKELAQRT